MECRSRKRFLSESLYTCCLKEIPLGNVVLCLRRNRTLGASVVRYSTWESSMLNFRSFSHPLFYRGIISVEEVRVNYYLVATQASSDKADCYLVVIQALQ